MDCLIQKPHFLPVEKLLLAFSSRDVMLKFPRWIKMESFHSIQKLYLVKNMFLSAM